MKEKKYKAYDPQSRKWFYFNLQDYMITPEFAQEKLCPIDAINNICECTNIKNLDSNLELYESDVIKFRANYTNKLGGDLIGVVVWNYDSWQIKVGEYYYSISEETDEFYYKWWYIGNIVENPNCLEDNQ